MKYLPDLIALCGLGLIVTGVWWIYPPAALIAGGAGLVYAGWRISE